jgi:catechol 2,3-dioxygenase-like lactoylglutathione lyase family enzyme
VTLIQHLNIPISDRERTRTWYEQVLGAEFLDRGPELNMRQLQVRIGSGEIHTTDTPHPTPSGHFAVEIHDWEEMMANLDKRGVPYTPPTIRAYSGGLDLYPGPGREYHRAGTASPGAERLSGVLGSPGA